MVKLDLDPAVETLLAPTLDGLRSALATFGTRTLRVTLGPTDGFYGLEGDHVVLSQELGGPGVHHPLDVDADIPVDRWRRAAASVLEAAGLADLAARPNDWRALGLAIWRADQAFGDLQVAVADLARARRTASPGQDPRAGYAVVRALVASGDDPRERIGAWLGGADVPVDDFVAWGGWVLGEGAAAALPVAVPRPAARDIPLTISPFSWQRVSVPPSARGGRIVVEGPGAVAESWGIHDRALDTLAAATDGEVRLLPEAGGPVGT
ncbi:MAG: hypothetical protein AAF211_16435 [Myxococcota bacterium]